MEKTLFALIVSLLSTNVWADARVIDATSKETKICAGGTEYVSCYIKVAEEAKAESLNKVRVECWEKYKGKILRYSSSLLCDPYQPSDEPPEPTVVVTCTGSTTSGCYFN